MEYASKGVANAGLATGIIGTALGVLGSVIIPNVINGGKAEPECSENIKNIAFLMHLISLYCLIQQSRKLL